MTPSAILAAVEEVDSRYGWKQLKKSQGEGREIAHDILPPDFFLQIYQMEYSWTLEKHEFFFGGGWFSCFN